MRALLVVALLCTFAFAEWSIIQQDYEVIALATSFVNETGGWVAGGTGSASPLFLFTEDGGQTFNNHGMADSNVGAMLSIRTAGPTWGVAGALGFLAFPCGAFTNDGTTWNTVPHFGFSFVCAFQGASAASDGTGVLIGSWSASGDWRGDGFKITTNYGKSWSQINGDFGTVPARYGDFLNKNLGFVTGGIWPETFLAKSKNVESLMSSYPLTRHLNVDLLSKRVRLSTPEEKANRATEGYIAMLAQVTNSGQDWTLMVNITDGGLYFNEISCVDSSNCWAVAEGVDGVGSDTASVFHTANGWQTYDVQLTVPGGSLVCIDMFNSTYGWAAGALLQGQTDGDFDGQFYLTTDGQNWVLDSSIKNFYAMDISVVDGNAAYSAGIAPIGLSSFAGYSP